LHHAQIAHFCNKQINGRFEKDYQSFTFEFIANTSSSMFQ